MLLSDRNPLLAARVLALDLPRGTLTAMRWHLKKLIGQRDTGLRQVNASFRIGEPSQWG
jgi:hypothetical protein